MCVSVFGIPATSLHAKKNGSPATSRLRRVNGKGAFGQGGGQWLDIACGFFVR